MVNGVLNAFAYIAKWLREMSLAGGAQNVFAICMFCLIGCVPLSGFIVLCIRNRKIDADYLLLGLSAVLFIGIYMMINPGYVIDGNALVTSDMLNLAISSVIWSVLACYAVLRIVESIDKADSRNHQEDNMCDSGIHSFCDCLCVTAGACQNKSDKCRCYAW